MNHMECIELSWLRKHMKKIRSIQPAITVLNWVKHQSFPVSIVKFVIQSYYVFSFFLVDYLRFLLCEKTERKPQKPFWSYHFYDIYTLCSINNASLLYFFMKPRIIAVIFGFLYLYHYVSHFVIVSLFAAWLVGRVRVDRCNYKCKDTN